MNGGGSMYIDAQPYQWPFDGDLRPENTALMIIDMQTDFVGKGGFVDRMGYDISLTAAAIEPTRRVLSAARSVDGLMIIHTREGHRPDLSDLHENKLWRSKQCGAEIGGEGGAGRILVRGEKGWDIVPELYPEKGEIIIDKPGKGAFWATDLDQILIKGHIRNIIFAGVTTDCCVSTTLRDANDRGYECITLSDCTAATIYENHLSTLSTIKTSYGLFGCVTDSAAVIEAFGKMPAKK